MNAHSRELLGLHDAYGCSIPNSQRAIYPHGMHMVAAPGRYGEHSWGLDRLGVCIVSGPARDL